MMLRRPHFIILLMLMIVPLAFQNCGESFNIADGLNVQGKGSGGGNGGGYDGKPGTYVLADLGDECKSSTATTVTAKQVIVVDKDGGMSRTVRDCQTLPVPEPVRASDLEYRAKASDSFVESGRLFQYAALDVNRHLERGLVAEVLCTWSRGHNRVGEARLRNSTLPEGVSSTTSSGTGLFSELFEEGEPEDGVTNVGMVDNTPSPHLGDVPDAYGKGILKILDSSAGAARPLSVSGLFFANRAAEGASVTLDNQTQSGTRCWMAY